MSGSEINNKNRESANNKNNHKSTRQILYPNKIYSNSYHIGIFLSSVK
jgi:hypothetical protein